MVGCAGLGLVGAAGCIFQRKLRLQKQHGADNQLVELQLY